MGIWQNVWYSDERNQLGESKPVKSQWNLSLFHFHKISDIIFRPLKLQTFVLIDSGKNLSNIRDNNRKIVTLHGLLFQPYRKRH